MAGRSEHLQQLRSTQSLRRELITVIHLVVKSRRIINRLGGHEFVIEQAAKLRRVDTQVR